MLTYISCYLEVFSGKGHITLFYLINIYFKVIWHISELYKTSRLTLSGTFLSDYSLPLLLFNWFDLENMAYRLYF